MVSGGVHSGLVTSMAHATSGSLPAVVPRSTGSQRSDHGSIRRDESTAEAAEGGHYSPAGSSQALSASVLVLNRSYMAVHIIGVRRAFGLLYRDLVEVINFEAGQFANYDFAAWLVRSQARLHDCQPHDDWIQAVRFQIQVPRVVRLLAYDRLPKQQLHLNRRNVLARDEHRCQYCARHLPTHLLSIDHVIPRSRGGLTSWENVVCACLACNIKKGGRTPQEARMKLARRPTKPSRNPLLMVKLDNPKYASWRTWLDGVSWDIGSRGYWPD